MPVFLLIFRLLWLIFDNKYYMYLKAKDVLLLSCLQPMAWLQGFKD